MFFSQEVQIITLYRTYVRPVYRNYINGIPCDPYHQEYNAYTAVVLPKSCSLKSLVHYDASEILFETKFNENFNSRDDPITSILDMIENSMGKILLAPNSEEPAPRIDKSAIPSICKITTPDSGDTQKESAESPAMTNPTQITIEGGSVGDDTVVGSTVLDAGNKSAGSQDLMAQKKRIWRVVGYTSSGEPCIEEHEPEASDARKSFPLSQNSTFDSRTVFTPGTSVLSDSGTVTPSVFEGNSVVGYTKELEEANKENTRLQMDLEEANRALEEAKNETERLVQELLNANGLCARLEGKIEEYQITIGSLNNEISSLKESIRVDQEARAIEKQMIADFTKSFLK